MAKKTQNYDPDQLYRYVGDGDGIPGLPKIVTPVEAAKLWLIEQFEAALLRGDYQPIEKEAANG